MMHSVLTFDMSLKPADPQGETNGTRESNIIPLDESVLKRDA